MAKLVWLKSAVGLGPQTMRACATEGKRWGKAYDAKGSFPEPVVVDVAAGSTVVVDEVTDPMGTINGCRVPSLDALWNGIVEGIPKPRGFAKEVPRAIGEALLRHPWGVVYCALYRGGVDFARTAAECRGLLAHWEALATARYRCFRAQGDGFEDAIRAKRAPLLAVWSSDTTNLRRAVEITAERLENASRAEREDAIARQVKAVLPTLRDAKHGAKLADEAFVREQIQALEGPRWDKVASADPGQVGMFLLDVDYMLSNPA